MRTPVGIVGFRGYSGAELVQILTHHPHIEPLLLEHREAEDRPRPLGNHGPRQIAYSVGNAKSAGLLICVVFLGAVASGFASEGAASPHNQQAAAPSQSGVVLQLTVSQAEQIALFARDHCR